MLILTYKLLSTLLPLFASQATTLCQGNFFVFSLNDCFVDFYMKAIFVFHVFLMLWLLFSDTDQLLLLSLFIHPILNKRRPFYLHFCFFVDYLFEIYHAHDSKKKVIKHLYAHENDWGWKTRAEEANYRKGGKRFACIPNIVRLNV